MNQPEPRVAKAIRRIGNLQKAILLWTAFQTPAFSEDFVRFVRARGGRPADRLARTIEHGNKALIELDARVARLTRAMELQRQGLHPGPSPELIAALDEKRPEISWSVTFRDRPPTRAESADYSYALRRLEERGLMTRIKSARRSGTGKTTRVRMTPTGVEAALHIAKEDFFATFGRDRADS